jgi:hypothetical protein
MKNKRMTKARRNAERLEDKRKFLETVNWQEFAKELYTAMANYWDAGQAADDESYESFEKYEDTKLEFMFALNKGDLAFKD